MVVLMTDLSLLGTAFLIGLIVIFIFIAGGTVFHE